MVPTIQSRLASLYDEANRISVIARRDVLSVRMSVVTAPESKGVYLPFDPKMAIGVWPDMGVSAGDEVIGLYKFGLRKQTERGESSYLIKPEVITAALLRFLTKSQ